MIDHRPVRTFLFILTRVSPVLANPPNAIMSETRRQELPCNNGRGKQWIVVDYRRTESSCK